MEPKMLQEDLLIHELAKLAEVSTRTIRYYAQEGLLPEPNIRGKYAYYTQEHLDRLKLILQLKDSYLPLKEIRQMLTSLSWQEVKALLANAGQPGVKEPPSGYVTTQTAAKTEGDSALDYIANVLKTKTGSRTPDRILAAPTSPARQGELLLTTPGPPPENWRRIQLTAGVELHIKEPYTTQDRDRIEQLIQFARTIFAKK